MSNCGTSRTPKGWFCTRNANHEGPCAAHPQHPLTEAWEQFHDENPELFRPITDDVAPRFVLNQRLQRAFTAGHAAGEMAERKRIVEKIQGTTT